MKRIGLKLVDIILAAQSLFALGIYLTFLIGNPPLWISWCIALIPWALRFWRTGRLLKRTPFDIPILIFIIGIIVGFLFSYDKSVSWPGLHTYLASILIFYGIVSNYEAKSSYWITLGGILCLLFIGLTIYTFFNGDNRHYFFNEWIYNLPKIIPQFDGVKASYNTPGLALGISIPLLLALAIFLRPSKLRMWSIGLLCIFLILLFFNGSGGGWLSAVIGIIFVLSCWKLWTLAITLPSIGVCSWIVISSLDITSPLAQTWVVKMFPLSSITERVHIWQNSINLLHNNVVTGLGSGTWYELYLSNYKYLVINPHNTCLQIYSDAGLLGGIAIVCVAIALIYICYRIFRSYPRRNLDGLSIGIIGSMLAGIVNGVFEVNTSALILNDSSFVNYLAIPFPWLLAAFLIVVYYRLRPES
jgi:O-antigen ligase